MRAGWHHAHFLFCVRETDGDGAVGAVQRDDAVVVAAALPEAPAGAVEGDERDKKKARREIGAGGGRRWNAKGVSAENFVAAPGEKARGAVAGLHARERYGAAGFGEGREQRAAVDLAADGPVAGDGRKLRQFERKVFDQLERGVARFKRAALSAHQHARIGFRGFEFGGGHC